MELTAVDQVRLNFNPQGLFILNATIGLMMLGVALDLKVEDFKRIIVNPKAPFIGLGAQFILLPLFTYILTLILKPHPSMALGMILVAACPGGNLSNIITYLARGNCAISISMTAVSTLAAIVMTPLNLALWGSLNPDTVGILEEVRLSPWDVFVTVFIILGIPLAVGLILARIFPKLADKVRTPFRIFSLIFFMVIVCGALAANWSIFLKVIGFVAVIVLVHNALALTLGFWSGRIFRLSESDTRAVAIEVGIQNSALGLVLVFNFFEGLGGMAIIVAWWGIWHIIAGLITAFIFNQRTLSGKTECGA